MKSVLTVILICVWLITIISCGVAIKENLPSPNNITSYFPRPAINQIEIITFDSCEYIAYSIGYQEGILTHKGNCKFCQQRKSNSCTTKE